MIGWFCSSLNWYEMTQFNKVKTSHLVLVTLSESPSSPLSWKNSKLWFSSVFFAFVDFFFERFFGVLSISSELSASLGLLSSLDLMASNSNFAVASAKVPGKNNV